MDIRGFGYPLSGRISGTQRTGCGYLSSGEPYYWFGAISGWIIVIQ